MGSDHTCGRRARDGSRRGRGVPGRTPRSTPGDEGEQLVSDGGIEERTDTGVRGTTVSVDDLFALLAQPGNRYILAYVVRSDGAVPYGDLVEYVVDMADPPEGVARNDFRERVATRLVHSNLPKLDDAGLVDYDATERTVAATDATGVAVPYLELAMEQSVRS